MGGALSVVETPRLIGRLPAFEHLDEFTAIMASPRVAETMGGPLHARAGRDAGSARTSPTGRLHDFGAWYAFERSTDQLVGRIGTRVTLVEGVLEVELAWVVHPDHWGQGYATELAAPARDLAYSRGLKSVVAFTLPTNTASRRVMEKLGMTFERDITHADLPHVLYRFTR